MKTLLKRIMKVKKEKKYGRNSIQYEEFVRRQT